jgi:beta-lactamase-like protein
VLRATAAEGPTLAAIARSAYDDLPAAPRALVERQTLAHLLELERVGRVVRGRGTETWRTT